MFSEILSVNWFVPILKTLCALFSADLTRIPIGSQGCDHSKKISRNSLRLNGPARLDWKRFVKNGSPYKVDRFWQSDWSWAA